ncbi:hypothetical protein GCM10010915_10730 [Microbacterium faecale]|uniref:HTH marR-type domain-containing protein n=1 Tax=Microbacterium faecale TaxID=1804630 RepID=A0A917DEV5_9MICO|nr:MarR family transcriptional regulator [Microbacterium faecale]GGD32210.1 hypothetical protein GCM10010915_10730 [Microbacterium faecale]
MSDDETVDAIRSVEIGLSEVFTQHRRTMKRNAERLQPGMLPMTYKVFAVIARRAPITASELAEWLEMDKGQISRTVTYLESIDLVTRRPDEADRRSFVIEPTESGVERLEAARTPHEETLRARLGHWDPADARRLGELLLALAGRAENGH